LFPSLRAEERICLSIAVQFSGDNSPTREPGKAAESFQGKVQRYKYFKPYCEQGKA